MLQADEGHAEMSGTTPPTGCGPCRRGTLTLAVTPAADESSHVAISVSDEGVGIAPEELEGIFQPFRGGFERGTGLGLAMVHRIVSDYSGEVKVNSTKGAGTTVLVRFPAATGAAVK